MREDLKHTIHVKVKEAAKLCDGRLPDHANHPSGRIPIAHIYDVIKGVMGKPAGSCRNERYDDILEIIDYCVDNAEQIGIIDDLHGKYLLEPKEVSTSLESFFI
jgi:hypothetical protein